MPTLFTPPSPPGPPTSGIISNPSGEFPDRNEPNPVTVSAGEVLNARYDGTLFLNWVSGFTNHGTIFARRYDYGHLWIATGVYRDGPPKAVNTGTIVVDGRGDPYWADVRGLRNFRIVENSGEIYAIADKGQAVAIYESGYGCDLVNDGLIAAYSQDGPAFAIAFHNSGQVINRTGGRIFAEGLTPVAVSMGGSSIDHQFEVENDGSIEAFSIAGGGFGIGLSLYDGVFGIANRGLIRADFAIAMLAGTVTNSGTIEGMVALRTDAFLRLENQAGGIINGEINGGNDVNPGFGDEIRNSGTINGSAYLGEGDDLFLNEGAGFITGIVNLGFGNDRYVGSAGTDRVAGDNGQDRIEGAAGSDLLLGGNDVDTLIGGAGRDRLYGERGNDVLVQEGGDALLGGTGDDRVELGDYSFTLADGGSGIDRLVLASGARRLDLGLAMAEGRIARFEIIELRGSQEIAVTAANVAALIDSGSELRIDATSSDKVHLVGNWTAAGQTTVGADTYARYTLDGVAVLVKTGAAVILASAVPAGFGGLDAIENGILAPEPGPKSGLYLTPDELYISYLEIVLPTQIYAGETWYASGEAPGVYADKDSAALEVNGSLIASNGMQSTAVAAWFLNLSTITNNGVIRATSTGANRNDFPPHFPINREGAYAVAAAFSVLNSGTIEAASTYGMAVGLGELEVSYLPSIEPGGEGPGEADYREVHTVVKVVNENSITANSLHSYAIGVVGYDIVNSGTIAATGSRGATALFAQIRVENSGTITASGSEDTNGIVFLYTSEKHLLINTGQITAEVAVRFHAPLDSDVDRSLTIDNSGSISGRVEGGYSADRVVNRGTIIGDILLGAGNDSYENMSGRHVGVVFGETGNDRLVGGAGFEHLDGGGGNDVLSGGDRADRLTGGDGADTFVYRSLTDSTPSALRPGHSKQMPDLITDFRSGIDKIDLSAIDAVAGTTTDDAFLFIGANAFSGKAGELRVVAEHGALNIYVDVNGDMVTDMHIVVVGDALIATDFIL